MTEYDPREFYDKAMSALYEDLMCSQPGERVQLLKVDIRGIESMIAALGPDHVSDLEDLTGLKLHQMKSTYGFEEVYQPKGDRFFVLCSEKEDPTSLAKLIQSETTRRPVEVNHSETFYVDKAHGKVRPYDGKIPDVGEVAVNPDFTDTSVVWVEFPVPETVTEAFVATVTDILAMYNTMAKRLGNEDKSVIFGERVENPGRRLDELRRTNEIQVDCDLDVVSEELRQVSPPPLPIRGVGQTIETDADLEEWFQ